MREHRLRELVQRGESQVFIAHCTCGWVGSACFHDPANARNEHRVHAMGFIDGTTHVQCAFCGDELPAAAAERFFFAGRSEGLRFLCPTCREIPVLEPSAAGDLSGVRADLIVLERELRCG